METGKILVRIKDNAHTLRRSGIVFTQAMSKYLGQEIELYDEPNNVFKTNGHFCWHPHWYEVIEQTKNIKPWK